MTTIVAFVPALHKGYIDFFKKYPDRLYLLDSDFVADFPKLERDLRLTDAEDMKKAIGALGIFKKVEVLHLSDVKTFVSDGDVVMLDEDISHELHEQFLPHVAVRFESNFLRWNKWSQKIINAELEVPLDRIISEEQFDREMMSEAFKAAEKSSDWWRQVGVALIKDGKLQMTGYNRHMPTDLSMDVYGDPRSGFDAGERIDLSTAIHGEAAVIARAAGKGIPLENASMYVTTFPCPNCAKLIAEAGIKKVYYQKGYSLLDAETILKAVGVEIVLVKPE